MGEKVQVGDRDELLVVMKNRGYVKDDVLETIHVELNLRGQIVR
jgi:hypothetical protein